MDTLDINETMPEYARKKLLTYADYEAINDENRYELIDGVIYLMSPGPTIMHQRTSGGLFVQLWTFLKDKPCEVYQAPCDVCLNAEGDNDTTVVQPDIFVVCDLTKLDEKRYNGAPDFVIEILSPSNANRDVLLKYNKYMQAGVREYWIVDIMEKVVRVCLLNDGKYEFTDYFDPEVLSVNVLNGCNIDMAIVFE